MNKATVSFKKLIFLGITLFIVGFMVIGMIDHRDYHPGRKHSISKFVNLKKWLDGDAQKEIEDDLLKRHILKPYLTRLDNQIAFSLFHHAKAKGSVVGKNNFLYDYEYIESYLGLNFIGRDSIEQVTERLKRVQDSLASLGIELLVLVAPGKGFYYPEYIPENWLSKGRHTTNYEVFIQSFRQREIEHIDFNDWFLQLKSHTPHTLYPKTGIHWSEYGESMVFDSLLHYIEQKDTFQFPQTIRTPLQQSNVALRKDDDIEEAMGLLFNIPDLPMTYPQWDLKQGNSPLNRPNVLVIGDSFYWELFFRHAKDYFNNPSYWYYFKRYYPETVQKFIKKENIPTEATLKDRDLVILWCSEMNLYKFPFGFDDAILN